jgi:beta-galactosidase
MLKRWIAAIAVAAGVIAAPSFTKAAESPSAPHKFAVGQGQFLLDGKPFQIISGEMHYQRIPRAYWRQRLQMARAMGLNSITTYVFWNLHEPQPGVYDFTGDNDVAEFLREAQQEGLFVVLRPGPYVCAEWEFGGFPSWLLKDRSMVIRSKDPKFMAATRSWFNRLGKEVASFQTANGGPILTVQVENEYGSFGDDHEYMSQIHQALIDAGINKTLFYTADGEEEVKNGSLPDIPVGINFGGGNARKEFAAYKETHPTGPYFNSEYWAGWFDHWGGKHASTNLKAEGADLKWMLDQGFSVSIYMFHGGTSFGWMNGANTDGTNYEPDVTSYDYDAPLDESGRVTDKFRLFREIIASVTGVAAPPLPRVVPPITVPKFALKESASLWKSLPVPVHSKDVKSMEDLDQSYGYILYRTQLKGPASGTLLLEDLHDYAQIYLDGKLVGTLDRRLGEKQLNLQIAGAKARLDILVENSGRINFATTTSVAVLRGERQGITKQVTLDGKPLNGWEIYPLPMKDPATMTYSDHPCEGPCFYRAVFNVDNPADTFLDTTSFTKGEVWLNGRALGRVWNVGPQKTLYVPAPWLKKGANEVIVFDLKGEPSRTLEGLSKPILGGPKAGQ